MNFILLFSNINNALQFDIFFSLFNYNRVECVFCAFQKYRSQGLKSCRSNRRNVTPAEIKCQYSNKLSGWQLSIMCFETDYRSIVSSKTYGTISSANVAGSVLKIQMFNTESALVSFKSRRCTNSGVLIVTLRNSWKACVHRCLESFKDFILAASRLISKLH